MNRFLGLVMAVLVVGCGSSASTDDASGDGAAGGDASGQTDLPTVIATTDIWADVVGNVACGGIADVTALIPSGADPHNFEPSLGDRAALDDAALIVSNGLHLEGGVDDLLDDVADDGTPVFVFADHLPTIGGDPHLWWNPIGVRTALAPLGDALVESAGLDRAAVDACVAEYEAELTAVDADVSEILDVVPADQRLLVTSHDSLAYFADRYDFEVIGTVIPSTSTMAEADPASMAALTDLVAETGVHAIFAEPQHSADDTNALADRVGGVKVVEIHSGTLGEAGSGFDTYAGFLRTNAQIIADALR